MKNYNHMNAFEPNLPASTGKRIVIVGGGFAGITLAQKIARPDYQVVLIDKNNFHQFQPLFYQVATAGLEPSAISYPFRKWFQNKSNFHFRLAEVLAIQPEQHQIETSIGTIQYDYLVLAMGATTNFYGNHSLEKHTYPLKSIHESLAFRNSILNKFEQALLVNDINARRRLLQFVVVGGGPTGVEVSGALAEMKKFILPKDYPELDFDLMQIYLVEGSNRVLNAMSPESSARATEYLHQFGVNVILGKTVNSYDGALLTLSDHTTFESKTVIWAAGVKPASIPGLDAQAYLPNKRLRVDQFNRVNGYDEIFALGDLAATDKPLPQVAQVAIQQAKRLASNLNKKQSAQWLPFKYHNHGTMATVGRNKAVAEIYGLRFSGFVAWFIWMFIHLVSLLGFKNRMQTFINWAWNYFSYDQTLRLIIHSKKENTIHPYQPTIYSPDKKAAMVA